MIAENAGIFHRFDQKGQDLLNFSKNGGGGSGFVCKNMNARGYWVGGAREGLTGRAARGGLLGGGIVSPIGTDCS